MRHWWGLLLVGAASSASALTLVREGQPTSSIVIATEPSEAAQLAAGELQEYLRRISGATVPIVAENQLSPRGETLILVGDSQLTAARGVRSAALGLEGIRLKTEGQALILLGDDESETGLPLKGTLYAVSTFLEHLGVRWLWPGETGTVIPRRPTITVEALDVTYVPPLRQRRIRNLGYNNRVQRGLDRLGWAKEDFLAKHAESSSWWRHQKLGQSLRLNYGHAYGNWWERFGADHPEWFALQPDGSRDQSSSSRRARLCVSNPELIRMVAAEAKAKLAANPQLESVSISPNDGGRTTFCMCSHCRAWDVPEAEKVTLRRPDGSTFEYPSLTDRFVTFYARVAELVAKEHPNRFLGAYAYSVYRTPPLRAQLPDNVLIGFVGFGYLNEDHRAAAQRYWAGWAKAAKHLFLRPNLLLSGMGFPVIYGHKLAEDLRWCVGMGLLVTDFDGCLQNWATEGLNYYVLAKLLWDPQADVEAIIEDYCRAGFGPAAEPVRQYFATLEEATDRLAASRQYIDRKRTLHLLAALYTDELLATCRTLLQRARALAQDQPEILARIAFLEQGLRYTQLQREVVLARHALREGRGDQAAYQRAVQVREAFYQELGLSWALNVPYLKFYGL
ncbi:MAG TPA: DUF4838 domain-containing protein [Armatimonadetes bacterium]|nr:DUF4838 domain-containing protein [Armatimonadota bacterium]